MVEVIGGSLSVGGCREYDAVVVLQNFEPCRDIGGVVVVRFLVQFEIGAQKGGVQLGNKLLAAITFAAPLLAAKNTEWEVTVGSGWVEVG